MEVWARYFELKSEQNLNPRTDREEIVKATRIVCIELFASG